MKKSKWKKTCIDLAECLQRQSVEKDELKDVNRVLTGELETLYTEMDVIKKQLIDESEKNSKIQQPFYKLNVQQWMRLRNVFNEYRGAIADDIFILDFLNLMVKENAF